MNTLLKKLPSKEIVRLVVILTSFFFVLFLFAPSGFAADHVDDEDPSYQPLAPLPGIDGGGEVTVAEYFSTIYQIGVSLVLVIAVVMLIYGGIQYMMSDSIGGKSGGRETIGKAIIGIVLAVSSYALLYLIGGAGSVTVGFDVPDVEYVAPPPPAETSPPEGIYCEASYDVKEYRPGISDPGLYSCPGGAFWSKFWTLGSGTFQIESERDLVDFYERSNETFPEKCQFLSPDARKVIVTLDMTQCQIFADDTGLLEPGNPQDCFDSIKTRGSASENSFFCESIQYYENPKKILFKLPWTSNPKGPKYDDPGDCYQLDDEEITEVDAILDNKCSEADGVVESSKAGGAYGSQFCVASATSEQCVDILAGEFMELDVNEDEWDEAFCDESVAPAGATSEQEAEFDELANEFFDDILTGDSYQTSGYYNDEIYKNGEEGTDPALAPGGGTRWHTGIDIGTGGQASGIKAPVTGVAYVMRTPDYPEYGQNGKIAIIEILPDGTERAWVFTHVDNFNFPNGDPIENEDIIEAGEVFARVGLNPQAGSEGFPTHLDLNIYTDPDLIEGVKTWGTNNTNNWSGVASGRYEDQDEIAEKTMCPFQAYWDTRNSGAI